MNYEELLIDLVQKDERFIIMTAENRAAIRNLPNIIKDRFIDTGIAEQTMIGMAAGLALRGRIPIVHALATFLTMRAFEFIRTDIGIPHLPVKLVGAVAGLLSEANGPAHQALEDISIMRGIPGMNVFSPVDEEDMILGLQKILPSPDPWYIRFTNKQPKVNHKPFEIGTAEIISEGEDITIITHGYLFNEALDAAELLRTEGKNVGLINIRTLKPLDSQTVLSACTNSELIVTLEDHFVTGGLYSIISELLINEGIRARVFPVAFEKWFKPAMLKDVLKYEELTSDQIAQRIINELERLDIWQTRSI